MPVSSISILPEPNYQLGISWILRRVLRLASQIINDISSVNLAGIKKTDMPERLAAKFEDVNYRIDWVGKGNSIFRKWQSPSP
jgi:hypothetical protein